MAIATNTYLTFDSKRNREEFSDAIHMITPEETPFMSMIGRENVESTHPEWSTDDLAAPNTANAVPQGDEFTYGAISPTIRVGNYTQISRKEYIVSRTQEKTLKAGPRGELARQRRKKGVELRKDMEAILLSNQASAPGNATTAPLLGGLPSWVVTNDDRGASGADGGFNVGTNRTVAATNGTQRAFSKALLDNVIQKNYNAGGTARALMLSPYNKTRFSGFMSDPAVAPQRMTTSATKQATIVGAADAYLSDFGLIDVVPNRVMAQVPALSRNAWLLDPEFLAVGMFDDVQEIKPAKTGDAEKRVLLCEYTLIVKTEQAIGVVADLYGMTASS